MLKLKYFMYLIVYKYNKKISLYLLPKSLFLLLFIPNLLIWYIILIYNDFLPHDIQYADSIFKFARKLVSEILSEGLKNND